MKRTARKSKRLTKSWREESPLLTYAGLLLREMVRFEPNPNRWPIDQETIDSGPDTTIGDLTVLACTLDGSINPRHSIAATAHNLAMSPETVKKRLDDMPSRLYS